MEIIVVDDGSSDDPNSVVKKFPQVKLIKHSKNLGSNAARATGLGAARGDYVFIADSDAIYSRECLRLLWQALAKKPKASFSYCPFSFVDPKTNKKKLIRSGEFNPNRLKTESYISWVSLTRRKDFLPPDPNIHRLNDWDHWLTMAEHNKKGVFVRKALFSAFLRPEGISSQGGYHREFWRLIVQIKHRLAPKVAIYTLTRDRLNYTKRTFKGLSKLGYPFDHYILDNGSIDGTPNWLVNYKKQAKWKVHLVLKKENIGIAEGKNLLIPKLVKKYDYILKLDNDCEIISENILKELIIVSNVLKNNAILSPKVEGLTRPVPRYAYLRIGPRTLSPVPLIGGIFCFSPRHFYNNYRSNRLFKIAKGDPEFADHVWRSGGKVYYVEDLRVGHMETSVGQAMRYPSYFKRRNDELVIQTNLTTKLKSDSKFRLKNWTYWNEVYQIDGNIKYKLLSLLSRVGFGFWYPVVSLLSRKIEFR